MAGELAAQSQSRAGHPVLWVTIHTAEGPTDDFPSQPDLDAGSARDLLAFGLRAGDRSWHACCDDDEILDDLVPYDRAAWTLRNGNDWSDNLEMCGLASWTRAEWLTHPGLLKNAARWVAKRCKARGITPRRLSITDVQGRTARGYMDHNTYTKATGDGTHWDVGPDFPWDVFGSLVTAALTGAPLDEEDPMAAFSTADLIAAAYAGAKKALNEGTGAGQPSWAETSQAVLGTVQAVVNLEKAEAAQLRAVGAAIGDSQSAVLGAVAALPTAGLSDEDRTQLASQIAALVGEHGITVDTAAIAAALGVDLAGRLAA